jgi:hypothetical protein
MGRGNRAANDVQKVTSIGECDENCCGGCGSGPVRHLRAGLRDSPSASPESKVNFGKATRGSVQAAIDNIDMQLYSLTSNMALTASLVLEARAGTRAFSLAVWVFFFLVVQTMHKDGVYGLHIGKCSKPHWAEHDCIRCTESSAVSFAMRNFQGYDCFTGRDFDRLQSQYF